MPTSSPRCLHLHSALGCSHWDRCVTKCAASPKTGDEIEFKRARQRLVLLQHSTSQPYLRVSLRPAFTWRVFGTHWCLQVCLPCLMGSMRWTCSECGTLIAWEVLHMINIYRVSVCSPRVHVPMPNCKLYLSLTVFFHGNLSSTQTTSKLPTVSMMRGCIFNSCNASLVKALYSRTMGSVRRDIHTPSRTHDMHFTKDPVFDSTVNLKSNKRGKQWE